MITFRNVEKSLGGRRVLDNLSFHVNEGETFMLVGPSGTGKSVTLSHIIGLMRPDAGSVIVDGLHVETMRRKELESLRLRTGMLFQGGALMNWMNIYDNVALPLRERYRYTEEEIRKRVMEILVFLELEDSMYKMPGEISGGMVKRAGLARAVVCEPKIMLYDEPTSGLDPVMSRKIDGLIDLLKREFHMTSVVVTHDLVSALNIGDTVAMLYEGRVIECAPSKTFMKSENPLVREFITAQFHTRKAGDL